MTTVQQLYEAMQRIWRRWNWQKAGTTPACWWTAAGK